MVLFYTSTALGADQPVTIYAGKDKYENETLLRYALPEDVWFHVDKLSSPHIYLRLPASHPDWEQIPQPLIDDCAQLVKAGSIQGNKQNNLTIIYTPASNVKKSGDMAVGTVTFHKERMIKRTLVPARENAIVNRVNKTRKEVEVDHEAEAVARQKAASKIKKAEATKRQQEEAEMKRQREQDRQERDYSRLFTEEAHDEADAGKPGSDDEDFFM